MSTSLLISTLESKDCLWAFMPRGKTKPRRRLYLTKSAKKDFDDRGSAINLLVGRPYVEAALAKWTLGERIHGDRKTGRFLKRLKEPPPEIWEIRITEPSVQGRLLGRFAEPDTLILVNFYTRRVLGGFGSPQWDGAMKDCAHQWGQLFGSAAPYSGTTIHSYITENCDDFPL